jgi:hypothetical protein
MGRRVHRERLERFGCIPSRHLYFERFAKIDQRARSLAMEGLRGRQLLLQ